MRALTAAASLLALSAVAFAKPNPVERPRLALVNADVSMGSIGAMHENVGSVGAMRERDYFRAPHPLSPAVWSWTCSPQSIYICR